MHKFKSPNQENTLEIKEEVIALLKNFKTNRLHYACSEYDKILKLTEIDNLYRNTGPDFFNFNRSQNEINQIIIGFKEEHCIPAIEVSLNPKEYTLRNGFHRFWLSHLAGFILIPVKIYSFWEDIVSK